MKNRTIFRAIILVCLVISSLFFVSIAVAGVTANECIIGGGSVAEGSGCKFCVGGKFDLSEIREVGKNNTPQSGPEQKSGGKSSGESGAKAAGNN